MSGKPDFQIPLEPERYELTAPPAYRFEVDRREFFKFLGAGILIVGVIERRARLAGIRRSQAAGRIAPQRNRSLAAHWRRRRRDGLYRQGGGRAEHPDISQPGVAEELHVPVSKIQMVMGDTELTPFDMGTFGSRTTPTMNLQLRKVAAAARDLLIGLAATQWQIDRKRLIAADGKVTDPETKRSVEYAALVKGQQLTQTVSAEDSPHSRRPVDGCRSIIA